MKRNAYGQHCMGNRCCWLCIPHCTDKSLQRWHDSRGVIGFVLRRNSVIKVTTLSLGHLTMQNIILRVNGRLRHHSQQAQAGIHTRPAQAQRSLWTG